MSIPSQQGVLYVVATPIGNLDDLSIRATKILAECDYIFAEDTRRTRQLLSHLNLSKPLYSVHAHTEPAAIERYAEQVIKSRSVALVSDAGTPVISDPGAELIRAVINKGGQVCPIPGPSAVLCALIGSGLATSAFRFVGFLPRNGQPRIDALATIATTPEPVVFFESPHRVHETLTELALRCPQRQAAMGRELTKIYEEFVRGTLSELAATLTHELRGEVTFVLGAQESTQPQEIDDTTIETQISSLLSLGHHAKEIASIVAARYGLPRREAYAKVIHYTVKHK